MPRSDPNSIENESAGGALPDKEVRRAIVARAAATLAEAQALMEVLDELEMRLISKVPLAFRMPFPFAPWPLSSRTCSASTSGPASFCVVHHLSDRANLGL
jgi:hypothetical protein